MRSSFQGVQALLAASASAALILTAAAAGAQEYDRVISFGDSLSDNGNLYVVTGVTSPPPQPASPPYNQRFSNGLVFTEILAGPMDRSGASVALGMPALPDGANLNFAFGGARADAAVAFPFGIPDQIGLFQASDQSFDGNELVTLYAGANDIFQIFPPPPAAPPTRDQIIAAGVGAAADVVADLQSLTALGARQIVVLGLPNLGATPRFNTSSAGSLAGSLATGTFNQALESGLQAAIPGLPAGTNVIFVDVAPAFAAVAADPTRFGFTNVTQGCLDVTSCQTASFAEQNRFLFFDGVHPTDAGYRLIADLVRDYIEPQVAAGGAGALNAATTELRFQQLLSAFDRARRVLASGGLGVTATADLAIPGVPQAAAYRGPGGPYVEARGYWLGTDQRDATIGEVRFGYDTALDPTLIVGGSVAGFLGEGDGDGPGSVSFDVGGGAIDLYAAKGFGAAFLTAGLGASAQSFDAITRQSVVNGLDSTAGGTTGYTFGAGVEAGYRVETARAAFTPTLALAGVVDHVEGYGDAAGAGALYRYGDRTVRTLLGAANLHVEVPVNAILLRGRLGYEDAIASSGDDLEVRAGSMALPQTISIDSTEGRGLIAGAGFEARLGERFVVGADYSAGFDDGDVSHIAQARLSLTF